MNVNMNDYPHGSHIHVEIRQWWDRGPGNTYHSWCAYFPDGRTVGHGFDYGTDSVAWDSIQKALGVKCRTWSDRRDSPFVWTFSVSDSARKKDLHSAGKPEAFDNEA